MSSLNLHFPGSVRALRDQVSSSENLINFHMGSCIGGIVMSQSLHHHLHPQGILMAEAEVLRSGHMKLPRSPLTDPKQPVIAGQVDDADEPDSFSTEEDCEPPHTTKLLNALNAAPELLNILCAADFLDGFEVYIHRMGRGTVKHFCFATSTVTVLFSSGYTSRVPLYFMGKGRELNMKLLQRLA